MTIGQDIDAMLAKVRTQRDELKLQAHLFKAEAREEWEKAEARWRKVQDKSNEAGRTAGRMGDELAGTIKGVAREIQEGYERIRKTM